MNLIDSLSDWLIASTIRASLLICIVLILQRTLRRVISPQWRFALWLPVIAVLLAPQLPQSRWSADGFRAAAFASLQRWDSPEPSPKAMVNGILLSTSAPEFETAPVEITKMAAENTDRPHSTAAAWSCWATCLWLAGAATMLGASLGAYARVWRKIGGGLVAPSEALQGMLSEAAAACGLRRMPRLVVSSAVVSPAVTGLFRPTLLLPTHFPGDLSGEETQLVLRHELMHLKRGDLPVNWLVCLAHALHWCNPIVWLAIARIRADRESACDAQVLELGSGDVRAAYGTALLKMEGALMSPAWSLGFIGIFERKGGMRTRICAIAGYERPHPLTTLIALLLLAALTLAGATRAQEAAVQPEPQRESSTGANVGAIDEAAAAEPDGRERVKTKLGSIIIPRLELREASVQDALAFLEKKSAELDESEAVPTKRGVKITLDSEVLKAPEQPLAEIPGGVVQVDHASARLTLSLVKIPLGEALRYVAGLANLKVRIGMEGVEVVRMDAPSPLILKEWMLHPEAGFKAGGNARELLLAKGVTFPEGASAMLSQDGKRLSVTNTPENLDLISGFLDRPSAPPAPPAPTNDLRKKLRTLIIPRLEFRNAALSEAVHFLKRKSYDLDTAETDPVRRGVNIVVKGAGAPADAGAAAPAAPAIPGLEAVPAAPGAVDAKEEPRLTISLGNIPLGEALRYVANLSGRRVSVGPYAVELVGKGDADNQLITKEWRPSEEMERALALGLALGPQDVKEALVKHGISFPPGASTIWLPSSRKLIMRNSPENAERLDELLSSTAGEPEQDAAQVRAESLVIPTLRFREATLHEIVDFIRAKSVETDPDTRGVNVVLDVPVSTQQVRLSLSLTNVTVWDALRQIARMAEVELTGEREAIRLHAQPAQAPAN